MDLERIFNYYAGHDIKIDDFGREFSKPILDLIPAEMKAKDLDDVHEFVDVKNKKC